MAIYDKIPLPMEEWMVKRGWDEKEVLRRLNECSLYVAYDRELDKMWYKEPLWEQWADLWSNDGKPGDDHDTRMEIREAQKRKYRAIIMRQRYGWLYAIGEGLWVVWQMIVMLIVLPLYCMGMGDAIHSMLGTGEYSGRSD